MVQGKYSMGGRQISRGEANILKGWGKIETIKFVSEPGLTQAQVEKNLGIGKGVVSCRKSARAKENQLLNFRINEI